jgi:cytochrome c peroxidase
MGQDIGRRNTPSLHGVAHNSWFFWDGRKDSLWSQALAPLENPAEHDFSRSALAKLILSDRNYYQAYTGLFSQPENLNPQTLPDDAQPSGSIAQIKTWKALPLSQRQQIDRIFANTGKALAAYVTTLKPLESRFDAYAQAMQNNANAGNSTLLHENELRGLRLFISSKAGCINCHSGPLFTNQSFHNIGSGGEGDSGRAAALSSVKLDRFNCLGEYSDATTEQCRELRFMQTDRHQLWGSFKTPTLRNVSNTAPYFHDGRYKTLAEVLDHYTAAKSTETHLPAIELSTQDKLDLSAFLEVLTARP